MDTIANTKRDTRVTGLYYLAKLLQHAKWWSGETIGTGGGMEYRPVNAKQVPLGKYQD